MKSLRPILCVPTALAVAALALAAGCSPKKPSNILAHVGDRAITVEDFQAEVKFRTANRQPLPDRQTLLDQMITREVLLQRARAAGLAEAPDVRRAFESMLIAKFEETRLTPQLDAAKVSPEEIRAAYQKDLARFTQPAKAQLAIIRIACDPKANTNQIATAAERAAELRRLALALPAETRGFGQLAADFSDDQITRYRGGDAGWFDAGGLQDRWPKAVVAAGFTLAKPGDISAVLREQDGFYLVKKLDTRAASALPLEQAQPNLQRRLLTARRVAIEKEFQQQQRAAVKVSTDAALLATVSYPTQNIAKTTAATPPAMPGAK